ncbi:hypothetical protein B0T25DRAFT_16492 [Lasiosphaeria hispida]|uniref:Uncharacterized protein n=1 Tax=Lasiosphaeria hispida TaxID=260671 RepID=A0AAJ0HUC0_9PEZI|nr:hypothetical protein B0T25DRAFT_16492 [Lasiosphaeria hispida]
MRQASSPGFQAKPDRVHLQLTHLLATLVEGGRERASCSSASIMTSQLRRPVWICRDRPDHILLQPGEPLPLSSACLALSGRSLPFSPGQFDDCKPPYMLGFIEKRLYYRYKFQHALTAKFAREISFNTNHQPASSRLAMESLRASRYFRANADWSCLLIKILHEPAGGLGFQLQTRGSHRNSGLWVAGLESDVRHKSLRFPSRLLWLPLAVGIPSSQCTKDTWSSSSDVYTFLVMIYRDTRHILPVSWSHTIPYLVSFHDIHRR